MTISFISSFVYIMTTLISLLNLGDNHFVLLTNGHINSIQFGIDALIQHFAKTQTQSLLVLLSQNWLHYSAIASKCGINLKHFRDQQLIRVIDAFDYNEFSCEQLVRDINKQISQLSKGVIIIDDISTLLSLNTSFVDAYKLVRQLSANCATNDNTLCIGTHFPKEEDDEEVNRFVVTLAHECDVWCEVDQIKTGFSSLISGRVKVRHQSVGSSTEMHFRLNDRSVQLLPIASNSI